MKKFIVLLISMISLSSFAQQQGIKTNTFIINGICDDCKERIENAADIKGVKLCKWSPDTKIATVTYDESKVNLEQIQKAIAKAGYDIGEIKGNDAAYNKLPKCCQYRSANPEPHKK